MSKRFFAILISIFLVFHSLVPVCTVRADASSLVVATAVEMGACPPVLGVALIAAGVTFGSVAAYEYVSNRYYNYLQNGGVPVSQLVQGGVLTITDGLKSATKSFLDSISSSGVGSLQESASASSGYNYYYADGLTGTATFTFTSFGKSTGSILAQSKDVSGHYYVTLNNLWYTAFPSSLSVSCGFVSSLDVAFINCTDTSGTISYTGYWTFTPASDIAVTVPPGSGNNFNSLPDQSISLNPSVVSSTSDFVGKAIDSSGNIGTLDSAGNVSSGSNILSSPVSLDSTSTGTTGDGTNTVTQTVQDAVNTIVSKLGGTVSQIEDGWKVKTQDSTITLSVQDDQTIEPETEQEIEEEDVEQTKTANEQAIEDAIKNLPPKGEDLLGKGWEDVTPEGMKTNTNSREYLDPNTGLRVRFDPAKPGASGFQGKDHYHVENPNSTGKIDRYLDINGEPAPRGSDRSHILPREE
ncbi:hypothetical protein ACJDU8_18875 [Clostridium sp. WILCCON 0269]|uniref:Bacterial toxin 24 domain-containing protein n=1 Tax=Candidatus Clostridium eludens TaxID=3381663 RepID=A0ABW8SPK0_9CLOT